MGVDSSSGVPANTGDVGHVNADGYVYITARKKDMITQSR